MLNDVLESRLPPKLQYLPVLRAATGVIAGAMSFNYDQIIQLRVAVSEAFDLAIKLVGGGQHQSDVKELAVRFVIQTDKIEILFPAPEVHTYTARYVSEQDESEALLNSLMDELELGAVTPARLLIRMVKYRSAGEA